MYIIKLNEQQTNCAVSVKFHSSLDFNEVKSVLWDMFQTPTPFPPLGTHPNKPRLFKLSDLNELQILQQLSNIFYFYSFNFFDLGTSLLGHCPSQLGISTSREPQRRTWSWENFNILHRRSHRTIYYVVKTENISFKYLTILCLIKKNKKSK